MLVLTRILTLTLNLPLTVADRLTAINKLIAEHNYRDTRSDAERSPSPMPEYDDQGRRTNTREQR